MSKVLKKLDGVEIFGFTCIVLIVVIVIGGGTVGIISGIRSHNFKVECNQAGGVVWEDSRQCIKNGELIGHDDRPI